MKGAYGGKGGGGYGKGGGGGYGGGGYGGGYGGGGAYSGKGGGKGGGGGPKGYASGPREEESIEVDDRDIGRIIGKGGATIRDLQDLTGCRIVTPQRKAEGEEPGIRQVKIQGPKAALEKCKEAITGVLMGDEPRDVLAELDGAVLMKNIDAMTMGHLAKMKDQLEKDNNITLDLDARSARIWAKDGNRDTGLKAKEAIEEAMEDITTVDTLTVPVPAHLVNQVINDSALRQLQDQTGLTANVSKTDEGTGIRLTGLAGAIEEAKELIERRNVGEGAGFLPLMPGMFTRMPPAKWREFQQDLGFLMQKTGAQVGVTQGSNKAEIKGGPEEVSVAKHELMQVLHYYFPEECDIVELPPESVDWIAGEDDRELMRLQSQGAIAALDRGAATLWICGNTRSVQMIRNRIRNSLQRWDREHFSMTLSSKNQCFAIIGSGGSTIRELQSSTGARIIVDPNQCTVMAAGKEESVRDAKRRILEIIGGAGGGGGRACFNCGGDHLARDCPQGGGGKGGGRGGGKGGGWDDGGRGGWDGGGGEAPYQAAPPPAAAYAAPEPAPAPFAEEAPAPARPKAAGRGRGASRW